MSCTDREFLARLFHIAVDAADPLHAMKPHLPDPPRGRTIVIGAGKGAAQMAAAFEKLWPHPCEGLVVTRYGYAAPTDRIEVREASHPVPDDAGLHATREILKRVDGLGPDDLVVALICGGGSSLLAAPLPGLTLDDERDLNTALLKSGAPISAMNVVRKCFSAVKGGRLALAAAPARVVTLCVSDVPGDDAAEVASGPTVPSASRISDALTAIELYGIALSPRLIEFLKTAEEPPLPTDAAFAEHDVHVIASAGVSLDAAAHAARAEGYEVLLLSDAMEGEAADIGNALGAIASQFARHDAPLKRPLVLLSGGETTVTIRGPAGRGGRNTECLLALSQRISGQPITALAADTDGIDGSETNAGAFADGETWLRLLRADHNPLSILKGHDAWSAFDLLGDLFTPGPTGTNVNDFRAIVVH